MIYRQTATYKKNKDATIEEEDMKDICMGLAFSLIESMPFEDIKKVFDFNIKQTKKKLKIEVELNLLKLKL